MLGTQGLHAITPLQAFNHFFAGEPTLDIRHRGLRGLRERDNGYWTVIFASHDCPTLLHTKGLILHYFQRKSTAPCRRCYNPDHTRARCLVTDTRLVGRRHLDSASLQAFVPKRITRTWRLRYRDFTGSQTDQHHERGHLHGVTGCTRTGWIPPS